MAKIKRDVAQMFEGIFDAASGKIAGIVIQKNNVIRIGRLKVKRKRTFR